MNMGMYKVMSGQNIFDVALHIYGSLDGLVDLFMNNRDLSFDTDLKQGYEIAYTDDLFVNQNVKSTLRANRITPSNGAGSTYYRQADGKEVMLFVVPPNKNYTEIHVYGEKSLTIDWGDNSDYESIKLVGGKLFVIKHSFDTSSDDGHIVKMYGDFVCDKLDMSHSNASHVYIFDSVIIRDYVGSSHCNSYEHISMSPQLSNLKITAPKIDSFEPLVNATKASVIDLSGTRLNAIEVSNYLIGIVNNYGSRAGCRIILPVTPLGEYKEPSRDDAGKYILSSGLEAAWVLTNEPDWQGEVEWVIETNDKIYKKEKDE